MVAPSCVAWLHTVVMVFAPAFRAMPADAIPEVTAVPLTVTVAVGSAVVGVTVMDVVLFPTDAV